MLNVERLKERRGLSVQRAQLMLATATRENRPLTADEDAKHAALITEIDEISARLEKHEAINSGPSDDELRASLHLRRHARPTLGDQFLAKETWKWLQGTKHTRPQIWQADASELDFMAATLTEDPASGGPLVVPQYLPEIVPTSLGPISVSELFAPGQTGSNAVVVMREKTFTNAAAVVAEGTAKPESALTFEQASEPVRKIAHWLPVSDELLEDAPGMRSYLDARLILGVKLREDDEVLNGTGAAPHLDGMLHRAGKAPDIPRADPATNADAILAQIAMVESTTGYAVDGIVLNPLNWAAIVGLKDTTGNYIGMSDLFSPLPPRRLFGRAVALTNQIAAGTGLVGAFKTAAQIFRHGGIRVDASNSHQDFFVKNLTAIRTETRLALAVYRIDAFGTVSGLTSGPIVTP